MVGLIPDFVLGSPAIVIRGKVAGLVIAADAV